MAVAQTGMRRPARAAMVALVAGLGVVGVAEPAGAAVTTFAMSPAAGSPGTVVHVRGRGCAPGVLGSGNANFVTVTATTLDVAFRAPVAANGRWSGAFTVPTGAAGSAPVTAACVSSNVLSLTTLYTPQVFRVTATPATTRPEPPTTGEPGLGPVYLPGDPTTTVGVPTTPRERERDLPAERYGGGAEGLRSQRDDVDEAPRCARTRCPTGDAATRRRRRAVGRGNRRRSRLAGLDAGDPPRARDVRCVGILLEGAASARRAAGSDRVNAGTFPPHASDAHRGGHRRRSGWWPRPRPTSSCATTSTGSIAAGWTVPRPMRSWACRA